MGLDGNSREILRRVRDAVTLDPGRLVTAESRMKFGDILCGLVVAASDPKLSPRDVISGLEKALVAGGFRTDYPAIPFLTED